MLESKQRAPVAPCGDASTHVDLMVMHLSCSSLRVSVKRVSPARAPAMIPALETSESVRVDLPWSTWAMTDMLRMFRFLSIIWRISSTVKFTCTNQKTARQHIQHHNTDGTLQTRTFHIYNDSFSFCCLFAVILSYSSPFYTSLSRHRSITATLGNVIRSQRRSSWRMLYFIFFKYPKLVKYKRETIAQSLGNTF